MLHTSSATSASSITESPNRPKHGIRFQQSLSVLIKMHSIKRFFKSCSELNDDASHELSHSSNLKTPLFLCLQHLLSPFFMNVGYVSVRFFDSTCLAVNVFFQTNTFSVVSQDLPLLCSFGSLFGAEVQSAFVHRDGIFNFEELFNYSNLITGMDVEVRNQNDLQFISKSSIIFPNLKQIIVHRVDYSVYLQLFKLLKENIPITSMSLNGNSIGDEGARVLAEALKVNTTLTNIDLGENSIGNEGAKALADALTVNTTVRRIELWNNDFGNEGAIALADALRVNTVLASLELDGLHIGDQGAIVLADVLKVNSGLTFLNLGYNPIGVGVVRVLAEALKVNTTLTRFDLSGRSIGDEGAAALADALRVNSSVTNISLAYNGIGVEGVRLLADMLKVNTTLTTLSLRGNSILQIVDMITML
ncbi:hypothetical protein GEMRC1_000185 [Eukaryota sp. GEM-RC1]